MWPFKKKTIFPEHQFDDPGRVDTSVRDDIYGTLGVTPTTLESRTQLVDIARDVTDIKSTLEQMLQVMREQAEGGG